MFATKCTSNRTFTNFQTPFNLTGTFNDFGPPLENDAFIVDFNLVLRDQEAANLITGYWTGQDCSGFQNLTICTLEAGIGEYTFTTYRDNSSVLDHASALLPKFIAFANNTLVNYTSDPGLNYTSNSGSLGHLSTLGGLVALVRDRYNLVVYLHEDEGDNPKTYWLGVIPLEEYQTRDSLHAICPEFRDPRDDIMRSINKLMVYLGAAAATLHPSEIQDKMDQDLTVNSTVIGQVIRSHNVFHSDYRFFIGAAAIELICIAFVIPTLA